MCESRGDGVRRGMGRGHNGTCLGVRGRQEPKWRRQDLWLVKPMVLVPRWLYQLRKEFGLS